MAGCVWPVQSGVTGRQRQQSSAELHCLGHFEERNCGDSDCEKSSTGAGWNEEVTRGAAVQGYDFCPGVSLKEQV